LIFVFAGAFGTVCALAALAMGSVRDLENRLPDGASVVAVSETERTLEVD
jgi:hypothetical protein